MAKTLATKTRTDYDQSKQPVAIIMREIQSSEAKTHLPQLLDAVEQGETIVITRHGRAIARLVPDQDAHQADKIRAMEEIKANRVGMGRVSVADLLSARDEGRRI